MPQREGFGSGAAGFGRRGMGMGGVILVEAVWLYHMGAAMAAGLEGMVRVGTTSNIQIR
jgi:hypothetical protein